jgi:hypothetical protein
MIRNLICLYFQRSYAGICKVDFTIYYAGIPGNDQPLR